MRFAKTTLPTLLIAAVVLGPWTPAAADAGRSDRRAASQFKIAHSLFEAGRLGEALSTVGRALEHDSRYVPAHLLRGMILFNMGEMEKALAAFDRTLALDRTNTEARNWRGFALVQLERFDDALEEYQSALEDLTYPTPERIHLNVGMLHRLRGNAEAAVQSLEKAVAINPSYARGHYELGVTYESRGMQKEALRAFQDARIGLDDDPGLNLKLGFALLKSGDPLKAREHFEKVLKIAPRDSTEAVQARDQIAALDGRRPAS